MANLRYNLIQERTDNGMHASTKARLLIVDDSKDICFLLSNHFKFRGFEADTAQNGNEAMKYIAKNRYEIVICDIIMPGMKGTEVLQKVKKLYPMIHVIMITGYVSLEHLLTCMRYGADTCIFKPMDNFSELDTAVEMALESMHRWEDKIIALKGLKSFTTQNLEIQGEPEKDELTVEALQ